MLRAGTVQRNLECLELCALKVGEHTVHISPSELEAEDMPVFGVDHIPLGGSPSRQAEILESIHVLDLCENTQVQEALAKTSEAWSGQIEAFQQLLPGDRSIPVYWGAQLVGCDQETVNGALTANRAQRVSGGPDFAAPLTLLPQQSSAWVDGLGLAGHRQGTGFATKLKTIRVDATDTSAQIELRDVQQGLGLLIELAVER